jgi:hypothetical protein
MEKRPSIVPQLVSAERNVKGAACLDALVRMVEHSALHLVDDKPIASL